MESAKWSRGLGEPPPDEESHPYAVERKWTQNQIKKIDELRPLMPPSPLTHEAIKGGDEEVTLSLVEDRVCFTDKDENATTLVHIAASGRL